jgi:hypothetical protein
MPAPASATIRPEIEAPATNVTTAMTPETALGVR